MQAPEWKMTAPKGGDAQHVRPQDHAHAAHGDSLRRATQRPARPVPLPRRDVAPVAAAGTTGTAVLLVDDEPDIVVSMREVVALLMPRFRVLTSASGKDALAAVAADPGIRAIVTDYQMQGMDGLELAERVHQSRPGLPVVVVSGFVGSDTRDLSLARGAYAFLPKPFSAEGLVETLKAAVASYRGAPPRAAEDNQKKAEAEAEERQEEDRNEQDAVQDTEEDAETALQDAEDALADQDGAAS